MDMEKYFNLKKGGRVKSDDVKSGKKPSIAKVIGMKRKKKKCPKCEGKGCSHCSGKGYHK